MVALGEAHQRTVGRPDIIGSSLTIQPAGGTSPSPAPTPSAFAAALEQQGPPKVAPMRPPAQTLLPSRPAPLDIVLPPAAAPSPNQTRPTKPFVRARLPGQQQHATNSPRDVAAGGGFGITGTNALPIDTTAFGDETGAAFGMLPRHAGPLSTARSVPPPPAPVSSPLQEHRNGRSAVISRDGERKPLTGWDDNVDDSREREMAQLPPPNSPEKPSPAMAFRPTSSRTMAGGGAVAARTSSPGSPTRLGSGMASRGTFSGIGRSQFPGADTFSALPSSAVSKAHRSWGGPATASLTAPRAAGQRESVSQLSGADAYSAASLIAHGTTRRSWCGAGSGSSVPSSAVAADSPRTVAPRGVADGRSGKPDGGAKAATARPAAKARREQSAVTRQLLERHRGQWQQQLEYEQKLQAEPGRTHHRFPFCGSSELESPWHSAQIEALAYQGASLLLTGEPIWLPEPASGVAAVGAALGAPSVRPREGAGRWPLSPGSRMATALPSQRAAESSMPCAANSYASATAPSAAPAGQFARASASFLGAEVLRCLSPRANVRPATTVHRHPAPAPAFLESLPQDESMPMSLYASTHRLDDFMGGGMLAPPFVGHGGPMYDPRATGPIAGAVQSRRGAMSRDASSQRPASPRGVSAKRHTAEHFRKLL